MKKFATVAACIAVAGVGLVAPAQAYDRDLYSYAASHMIGHEDIPSSLNAKTGADFGAFPSSSKNFLCGDDTKQVEYPGGEMQFSVNYEGKKNTPGIGVTISQYKSSAQAIRAFNELKDALKRCEGPASGQQTFEDGNSDTWSRLNTTGNVPLVTIAGVPSVFLNQNYQDITSGEDGGTYSSDSYNVYTLVGDVIINTSRYTGSELNMSTKERRAVNQVAFNAVTRWLD